MPAFYHCLFAFALLSRISDLLTTWLVSPKLKLEGNPILRKLRWPYAFLTLFSAFLAYYWPPVCVTLTTVSFLVAGSNAMKIAQARSMGEDAYYQMAITNAAKDPLWAGLFYRLAPCPFYAFLAGFMFFFIRDSSMWEYWIAYGVGLYAFVLLLYSSRSYFRYRKLGRPRLPATFRPPASRHPE